MPFVGFQRSHGLKLGYLNVSFESEVLGKYYSLNAFRLRLIQLPSLVTIRS